MVVTTHNYFLPNALTKLIKVEEYIYTWDSLILCSLAQPMTYACCQRFPFCIFFSFFFCTFSIKTNKRTACKVNEVIDRKLMDYHYY